MKNPLWLDTVNFPDYQTLNKNIEVDICIVGAGITGITLAYRLRDSGLKIALIDSDKVLHGSTAYTTAKVTAQHHVIYHDLIKDYGEENAQLYANAQKEALNFIVQSGIDCDLEHLTSYVYTQQTKHIEKLEQEHAAAKKLGFDCELTTELELPFPIETALAFHNQAQFNPLKYLMGLLKEIEACPTIDVYEHTTAVELNQTDDKRHQIKMANNQHITAKKVVQASHYPFYDGLSLLIAKMEARKSYLVAAKNASQKLNGAYLSYESPSRTMRQYKDFLILGGEDHRTGVSKDTNQHYDNIRHFVQEHFNTSDIDYQWSTQDYSTLDKIPFIGSINDNHDIYVATGYQKWGMTNGTFAALLLHDLLLDIENPATDLFSPKRTNLAAQAKDFITYNSRVVYELIIGKLQAGEIAADLEGLKPNQAKTIYTSEGDYGVYKDEDGNLHKLDITCPHMGCELKFNQAETTWDCPCHGSRFCHRGSVIAGPAHHGLQQDKNKIDPNIL